MEHKRIIRIATMVFVVALLTTGLIACSRPASQSPTGQASPTVGPGDFPLPGIATSTEEDIDLFGVFATETARAAMGEQPPPAEEPTQEPPAVTNTPAPPAPQEVATAVPVSIPQPTAGIPTTYTLQKGEHPFCIARRFNVNQTELLNLNGLTLNSKPAVGFVLRIPQTGNSFVTERALKPHPTTYTVRAGDTIHSIACAFGDVSPDMIALANNLSAPYTLQVGEALQIP